MIRAGLVSSCTPDSISLKGADVGLAEITTYFDCVFIVEGADEDEEPPDSGSEVTDEDKARRRPAMTLKVRISVRSRSTKMWLLTTVFRFDCRVSRRCTSCKRVSLVTKGFGLSRGGDSGAVADDVLGCISDTGAEEAETWKDLKAWGYDERLQKVEQESDSNAGKDSSSDNKGTA